MTNTLERYIALTPGDGDAMAHVYRFEGSIYRGIQSDRMAFVQGLFENGLIAALEEADAITPCHLVKTALGDYPMAIEQRDLTPPVTAQELPPSMRRDAGLMLLKVAKILDQHGLALRDLNLSAVIVNSKGQPVFHNLDGIVEKDRRKFPYAEFHANFLGPMRLIHEKPELAALVQRAGRIEIDEDVSIRHPTFRSLIRRIVKLGSIGHKIADIYQRTVVLSPFGGLLHTNHYVSFLKAALREREERKAYPEGGPANWTGGLVDDLERQLSGCRFERVTQRWTEYHAHLELAEIAGAGEEWGKYFTGPREQALRKVLSETGGSTLLDVGANNGYFSMLGAHCGYNTTAVDYDIGAIDRLYCFLTDAGTNLPVRPLIFDFVNLTPMQWPRFRADVVFALGFVHHMRLVELLRWSVIAERLAGLTGKVLVTEFKPGTGAGHTKREMTDDIENDYRLENLIEALEKHFPSVEVIGDHTMIGFSSLRTMIVCRRQ